MLIASLLSIWYCFNRAHLLQMAGDSVGQRRFLAGARLPKRLLRLYGPVRGQPGCVCPRRFSSFIKNPVLQLRPGSSAGEVAYDHNKKRTQDKTLGVKHRTADRLTVYSAE